MQNAYHLREMGTRAAYRMDMYEEAYISREDFELVAKRFLSKIQVKLQERSVKKISIESHSMPLPLAFSKRALSSVPLKRPLFEVKRQFRTFGFECFNELKNALYIIVENFHTCIIN